MIRMFIFFALLLAAAMGVALLLETPGSVLVTYGDYEYRLTLAKAIVILAALGVAVVVLWSVIRTVLRLPSLIAMTNRMRRKARGYSAVSRGLVSVGVGDRRTAGRYAAEAERLLGRDPMTLLLKAQSAQLSGDRKGAEAAFTRMLDNPETRVLGLRGLFIEARREGRQGARAFAEEAYRLAPASPWAGQAVLEYRTAEKDWRRAMAAVDEAASRRVIDRDAARRQKATLFAAEARDAAERSPETAYTLAMQALKLNPGHVPAAQIAAERLSAKGDYAKASRLIEQAWRIVQHPDLAEAYLSIRHGDSTHDRLKRARALLKLAPKSRESGLVLAKAAIDAREFGLARETLEPIVLNAPTARACRLMAELEDRETGAAGLVRKWLARASRAPRDPAWVADGFVSDDWAPVSPVTGRIDAFEWKTPPQSLEASVRAAIDADESQFAEAPPPEALAPPPPESLTADIDETAGETGAALPTESNEAGGTPGEAVAPARAGDEAGAAVVEPVAEPAPEAAPLRIVAASAQSEVAPATAAGVLTHLPDDPGPRRPDDPRRRSGLFN